MINKSIEAQIKLLEDPDKSIYTLIRNQLIERGVEIVPALEQEWSVSDFPLVQERIESIIHEIQFNQVVSQAELWVSKGRQNWFEILLIISRLYYQNLDEEKIKTEFIALRKEIWLEINDNLTAFEKIQMVNHVLFKKHHFTRQPINSQDKSSYFLSELLLQKKGNDLSMGLFYQFLCQSLDMPVYAVNLPGNLILSYMNSNPELSDLQNPIDVIFYINPANGGTVFGMEEINKYLDKHKIKTSVEYFVPSPNNTLLKRYIDDLIAVLKHAHDNEKVLELEKIRQIICF